MPMFLYRIIVVLLVGKAATAVKMKTDDVGHEPSDTTDDSKGAFDSKQGPDKQQEHIGSKIPFGIESVKCVAGAISAVLDTASFGVQTYRYLVYDREVCSDTNTTDSESVRLAKKNKCHRVRLSATEGFFGILTKFHQLQGFCAQWESVIVVTEGLTNAQKQEKIQADKDAMKTSIGQKLAASLSNFKDSFLGGTMKEKFKYWETMASEDLKAKGMIKLCRSFYLNTVGGTTGMAAAVMEFNATCAEGFKKKPTEPKIIEPCPEAQARSSLAGVSVAAGGLKVGLLINKWKLIRDNVMDFKAYYALIHESLGFINAAMGIAVKIIGTVEECGPPQDDMDSDKICHSSITKIAAKALNLFRSLLFLGMKCLGDSVGPKAFTDGVFEWIPPFNWNRISGKVYETYTAAEKKLVATAAQVSESNFETESLS